MNIAMNIFLMNDYPAFAIRLAEKAWKPDEDGSKWTWLNREPTRKIRKDSSGSLVDVYCPGSKLDGLSSDPTISSVVDSPFFALFHNPAGVLDLKNIHSEAVKDLVSQALQYFMIQKFGQIKDDHYEYKEGYGTYAIKDLGRAEAVWEIAIGNTSGDKLMSFDDIPKLVEKLKTSFASREAYDRPGFENGQLMDGPREKVLGTIVGMVLQSKLTAILESDKREVAKSFIKAVFSPETASSKEYQKFSAQILGSTGEGIAAPSTIIDAINLRFNLDVYSPNLEKLLLALQTGANPDVARNALTAKNVVGAVGAIFEAGDALMNPSSGGKKKR